MYNKKVLDHFTNPRNVGSIENADGVGEVGNPVCGDMMTFYIKVKDNKIKDVKFKTFGCGAAIAVSSMVSEMAKGSSELYSSGQVNNNETYNGFTAPQFALVCDVSAKTGEGLHRLEKELSQLLVGSGSLESHTPMLSRTHQRDSMRRAQACVARMLLDMHISPELLALELREALDALGEITGETTSESLLDRIFSAFCIGK